MTSKKYELTSERNERGLYRIRALRDIPLHRVTAGDLGGWVESEVNLAHDRSAWVSEEGQVYEGARVTDDARVYGWARVFGRAEIRGAARVRGDARVYGAAQIYRNAQVYGDAEVFGNAEVFGSARVYGNASVRGRAWVCGDAEIYGASELYGDAGIEGRARVYGRARICGNVRASGDARVYGNAQVSELSELLAGAGLPSGSYVLFRTAKGHMLRIGCWEGTVPGLREMIAKDFGWPGADDDEIPVRRPMLEALADMCEAVISSWKGEEAVAALNTWSGDSVRQEVEELGEN